MVAAPRMEPRTSSIEEACIAKGMRMTDQRRVIARTIEAAVARAQAGQARLANPREHLRYDPGIRAHIDALLALAPGAGEPR